MSQSYLIFSDGRKLKVRKSSVKHIVAEYDGKKKIFSEKSPGKIVALVNRWEKGNFKTLTIKCRDTVAMFEKIKSTYDKFIVAAGGLVVNRSGKLLVIFRKGKWDLPKGKIEKKEKVDEGALREVLEETGLRKVNIVKEFLRTYHTYEMGKKQVLKETVWYMMFSATSKTSPQLSEGIVSAKWISVSDLEKISENTYENILLLLKKYFTVSRKK